MSDFEAFDPNAPTALKRIWATWNGHRFRSFANRGAAINSMAHESQARLFEFDAAGARWEERARKYDWTSRPSVCDCCNMSTLTPRTRYDYQRNAYIELVPQQLENTGEYVWERDGNAKIVEPVALRFLCEVCR